MTIPTDLRSRKRLATRQAISNAATRLFFVRGFEQVTVDEIAAAANVGRMTVFNHFPRKEDMFFDREEEGRELLREAWRRIQAKGYTLGNVDVTIIAQAPKMLPHIPQMRVFIAEDLGCHMDDVNVKATTTEKLGFTGRGEGIACEAVALLRKADK